MKIRVVSESDQEGISLEEARAHLEAQTYGDTDVDLLDDAMILGWLRAARQWAERFTGLSYVRRVYEGALDAFPAGAITLPLLGPLVEVTQITAGNATSSSSDDLVLTPDVDFVVDPFVQPLQLHPYPGPSWPAVVAARNGVRVQFVMGYGAESDTEPLPFDARAAILLVLGHLYAHRETNTDRPLADVPLGAEALLRPARVRLGMA